MTIYKAKPEVFLDEGLTKQVQVYMPIFESGKFKIIGMAQIHIPGVGNIPVQFPIEVEDGIELEDSLIQAFEKYDEELKLELQRLEQEQIEEQRAAAVTAPPRQIII